MRGSIVTVSLLTLSGGVSACTQNTAAPTPSGPTTAPKAPEPPESRVDFATVPPPEEFGEPMCCADCAKGGVCMASTCTPRTSDVACPEAAPDEARCPSTVGAECRQALRSPCHTEATPEIMAACMHGFTGGCLDGGGELACDGPTPDRRCECVWTEQAR